MGALSAKKGTADHVHNNDNDSHGLPDMFRWLCIVMHFLRRRDQVCVRGPGTCRTERIHSLFDSCCQVGTLAPVRSFVYDFALLKWLVIYLLVISLRDCFHW